MQIANVESLEIHEGDTRLWTVYTHGDDCRHLQLLANRIEGDAAGLLMFTDPQSDVHGNRYSEIVFDTPRNIEVVNDTIRC